MSRECSTSCPRDCPRCWPTRLMVERKATEREHPHHLPRDPTPPPARDRTMNSPHTRFEIRERLRSLEITCDAIASSPLVTDVLRDKMRAAAAAMNRVQLAVAEAVPREAQVATVRAALDLEPGGEPRDGFSIDVLIAALRRFDRSEFSARTRRNVLTVRRLLWMLAEAVRGDRMDLVERALAVTLEPHTTTQLEKTA